MAKPLTREVTRRESVDPHIADLVHFVNYLKARGVVILTAATQSEDEDNAILVNHADAFWEQQHGDD